MNKTLIVVVDADRIREAWVNVDNMQLLNITLMSNMILTEPTSEYPCVGDGGSNGTYWVSSENYQRVIQEVEVVEEVVE